MDLFHCINQYIDYLVYIGVLNTKTRKIFETFFQKEKTSQKKSPSTPNRLKIVCDIAARLA